MDRLWGPSLDGIQREPLSIPRQHKMTVRRDHRVCRVFRRDRTGCSRGYVDQVWTWRLARLRTGIDESRTVAGPRAENAEVCNRTNIEGTRFSGPGGIEDDLTRGRRPKRGNPLAVGGNPTQVTFAQANQFRRIGPDYIRQVVRACTRSRVVHRHQGTVVGQSRDAPRAATEIQHP